MDDVNDLAQEIFLIAFRKLDQFETCGDFGAWLGGIARHELLMHFRAAGRRNAAIARFREEVAGVIERDLESECDSESRQGIEALLRCISKLPERMRHVVRSGLDGMKAAIVAGELSTTVGAVYNLQYRANALLRECVKTEME